jgi:aspartate aminotransferase
MADRFSTRRQLLSDGLGRIPGVVMIPPEGAFYAFPDVSAWGLDSMSLCRRLLAEVGLAVVPGLAFGDDRCIRLSCAAAEATLEDGLDRLARFQSLL